MRQHEISHSSNDANSWTEVLAKRPQQQEYNNFSKLQTSRDNAEIMVVWGHYMNILCVITNKLRFNLIHWLPTRRNGR